MNSNKSKISCKRGFTLIELLVVVLIIGILAAVAVPQYQKAILKSRLTQWDVAFDAGRKAVEAYLLENGWQEGSAVFLTGKNRVGTIEMPGNCDIDNWNCYTSAGRLRVYCQYGKCAIQYHGNYNADGTSENKAIGASRARFVLSKNGNSYIDYYLQGKTGCLWVAERHPDIPVQSEGITDCKNTYGVTLPNPVYTE